MLDIQKPLYVDFFWDIRENMDETLKECFSENEELTDLSLLIDRGVHSFRELKIALKECYPNLKHLVIEQDYSIRTVFHHFLNFVRDMKLDSLTVIDLQTEFFDEMTEKA